ncbi:MAG: hypothetical protein K2K08_07400, partial [Paramuribaculum sp.]|nr:hypothetical protein [Paramuribaculum sp.]
IMDIIAHPPPKVNAPILKKVIKSLKKILFIFKDDGISRKVKNILLLYRNYYLCKQLYPEV